MGTFYEVSGDGAGYFQKSIRVNGTASTINFEGVGFTPQCFVINESGENFVVNAAYGAVPVPWNYTIRARGTQASMLAVQNGDSLGGTRFLAYDGTTLRAGAEIAASITGAVSTNIVPSTLTFRTEDTAGAFVTRMSIGPDGTTDFTKGVKLPTSGGTASLLDYYEEGTLTVDWEGPWAVNQTNKSIHFTRTGNLVTLEIEAFSATANTEAAIFLTSGDELPTRLRPTNFTQDLLTLTVDDGITGIGLVSISLSGGINFYASTTTSSFFSGVGDTGIGSSGAAITLSYHI